VRAYPEAVCVLAVLVVVLVDEQLDHEVNALGRAISVRYGETPGKQSLVHEERPDILRFLKRAAAQEQIAQALHHVRGKQFHNRFPETARVGRQCTPPANQAGARDLARRSNVVA
jgi:hypothetical protein